MHRLSLIPALVLALLLTAGCLHSGLTIPAGQQFELDASQAGPYSVQIRNTGKTEVLVRVRDEFGERDLAVLAPSERERARLPSGRSVVLVNDNARAARLEVDLG